MNQNLQNDWYCLDKTKKSMENEERNGALIIAFDKASTKRGDERSVFYAAFDCCGFSFDGKHKSTCVGEQQKRDSWLQKQLDHDEALFMDEVFDLKARG